MRQAFTLEKIVQPHIQALKPYQPHLFDNVIKLDANENPYAFPGEVRGKIYAAAAEEGFARYPDPFATRLRKLLAEYTGVPADQIMAGNGSDELILDLMLTFAGPGARVIIPTPTFSMYKISSLMSGATPVEVPLNQEDFNLDMGAMKEALQQAEARVVYLCSPNNPTGNLISQEQIRELCTLASDKLVIVDEAYGEFDGGNSFQLLREFDNLVILRTFSKAFGMAGLRIGYLLTSKAIMGELRKVKLVYNLNAFSQLAACTALENLPVFQKQLEQILQEKQALQQGLQVIAGVKVYPSAANYFLIKTPLPGDLVHHQLIEKGVLVRYMGVDDGLANCLRVTVGTKEENAVLLSKLEEILQQNG